MATKTFAFDAAELLDSTEAQVAYLSEVMEGGDAGEIAQAIGTVARARGMTSVARDAGVGRESLYKALSGEGNPEFGTILRVLGALGLGLSVTPKYPAS
jgi:probable addiction module antidote protein